MALRRLLLLMGPLTLLALTIPGSAGAISGSAGAQAAPTTCFGQPATAGMTGTPGSDTINGTDGDDVIIGLNGNDTIDGKGGNDTICGGTGDGQPADQLDDDRIAGGSGNDRVNGGFGNDLIDGEGGDDTLIGDSEEPTGFISTADTINGGDGEDSITGGGDQDILRGESGFDTIRARDVGGEPARNIIDVVIGGPDGARCDTDSEDDVSECDARAAEARPEDDKGSSSNAASPEPDRSPSLFSQLGSLTRRCLPGAPIVSVRGIGSFRIGERAYRSVLRPLVIPLDFFPRLTTPLFASRGRLTYCNDGGGRTYILSASGRLRFVATSAAPRRTREIGAGDGLASMRRAYPRTESIGAGLYRASGSSRVIFVVRGGRVRFVAVASRALAADPAALRRTVRRLPVGG